MIQERSILKVADNSGALLARIVSVKRGKVRKGRQQYAKIVDQVKVSIRKVSSEISFFNPFALANFSSFIFYPFYFVFLLRPLLFFNHAQYVLLSLARRHAFALLSCLIIFSTYSFKAGCALWRSRSRLCSASLLFR